MEHPHAEFLRAIADGDDIDQWMAALEIWPQEKSAPAGLEISSILNKPNGWKVWRKPKTITYSVTIHEPITEAPPIGTVVYWYSQSGHEQEIEWVETESQSRLLKNRQLFDTAEKARLAFIRRNNLPTEI